MLLFARYSCNNLRFKVPPGEALSVISHLGHESLIPANSFRTLPIRHIPHPICVQQSFVIVPVADFSEDLRHRTEILFPIVIVGCEGNILQVGIQHRIAERKNRNRYRLVTGAGDHRLSASIGPRWLFGLDEIDSALVSQ